MVRTNDIYYTIDHNIVSQGFWNVDIDEKKKLIDLELKKYIISKISEIETSKLIADKEQELSVNELLSILSNLIKADEQFETLRHFTHYIIQVTGTLQGYSIIWFGGEDEKLIENPEIEFNEDGYWNTLTTYDNTDYVKTFNFVYDVFTNNFMVKNPSKKIEMINKLN